MTVTRASAPGKVILFGEHAVVYGQPALAVPVTQVQATAVVQPWHAGLVIDARTLGRRYRLEDAGPADALAAAVRLTLARAGVPDPPAVSISIESNIPIASGLGSGAAVCTAIVRALSEWLGRPSPTAEISSIVFETEKILHGTPSGIDNTVIAYGQPVYFVKGYAPVPFDVARPFQLLIADTGIPSPTRATVGDVRAAWQKEPERHEQMFRAIGEIAKQARAAIESGQPRSLGPLMDRNHELLRALGVSGMELDVLVEAARAAGALGAKLSGGGRGGNMMALVTPETEVDVCFALREAGATRVIETTVETTDDRRPKAEAER
jgi:mevalonate kinase